VSKPDDMKVQPFFYHLKELNDYIDWLPGDELALTDAQLNLAFFNGMPGSWRVRYAISGRSAHTTHAELLHYFRVQEHEQMTKDKIAKKHVITRYKEFKNGSNRVQNRGQFKKHIKSKQGCQTSNMPRPRKMVIMSVSLHSSRWYSHVGRLLSKYCQ
jgi:triacylglycerol esterase/lipase EstA (alpha/beta hydrolase family)